MRPTLDRELRRELSLIRRVGTMVGDIVAARARRPEAADAEWVPEMPSELTLKWAQWASTSLHAQANIKNKAKPIKEIEDDDDLDAMLSRFLRDVDPERRELLLADMSQAPAKPRAH